MALQAGGLCQSAAGGRVSGLLPEGAYNVCEKKET